MSTAPSKYLLPDGNYIAYHQTKGKENKPGIVFLGGFMSDMTGTKATALENFCQRQSYSFVRFDYFGHGQSSGTFVEGTIGRWRDNALAVLDHLTTGPQILIGSSLGGWLMLLVALARPQRIKALLGIASAPDFTEELIWEKMTQAQQDELLSKGTFLLPSEYNESPYPISRQLIEEARNHLLLQNPIPISCPVRLLHGKQDDDVPFDFSIRLGEQLTTTDMCVNLIPHGDHRMSSDAVLEVIFDTLRELAEKK